MAEKAKRPRPERAIEERMTRYRVRSRRLRQKIANLLELPSDVVLDLPRVVLVGNVQAVIENHRGLIEYSPGLVRVGLDAGQLVLTGENLVIGTVGAEDMIVLGRIIGLEYRA